MKQITQTHQIRLVFTTPTAERALPGQGSSLSKFFTQMEGDVQASSENNVQIFPDLDHGLEWCENQLLLEAGIDLSDDSDSLRTQLSLLMPENTNLEGLLKYFERLEVGLGDYLIRQGDPPENLYLIESGQLTVQLEHPGSSPIRLETMRGGRVVGEMGFYLNQPRTAAVIVDAPSIVYRLSVQTMKQMEKDAPESAAAFHKGIIRLVSERLASVNATLDALQD